MSDGFQVDAQQIRAHATKVDAIQQRFAAVRSASTAIVQDDAAYGLLCGWMAGILEARHTKQDELYTYVEENLRLASDALIRTSQDYERADDDAADRLRRAGGLG
ncbi:type VII secretion target [Paractinoplanes maris]|uniref:type VII secretion target n=1 Tax=Paractinoplanes maris TaxID=1734446 RepID=UPI0020215827|nr:type VII secretion target [Actinoplanes maris]